MQHEICRKAAASRAEGITLSGTGDCRRIAALENPAGGGCRRCNVRFTTVMESLRQKDRDFYETIRMLCVCLSIKVCSRVVRKDPGFCCDKEKGEHDDYN